MNGYLLNFIEYTVCPRSTTKLRYIPIYEGDRKKAPEWTNLAKVLDFGSPEGVLSTSSG